MSGSPIKVLLQTTIPTTADDWSIARFSLLGQFLLEQQRQGAPLFEVTMRDRDSFHHFVDYNWDLSRGCPSFVAEPPGTAFEREPNALPDSHRYVLNVALWLAGAAP